MSGLNPPLETLVVSFFPPSRNRAAWQVAFCWCLVSSLLYGCMGYSAFDKLSESKVTMSGRSKLLVGR